MVYYEIIVMNISSNNGLQFNYLWVGEVLNSIGLFDLALKDPKYHVFQVSMSAFCISFLPILCYFCPCCFHPLLVFFLILHMVGLWMISKWLHALPGLNVKAPTTTTTFLCIVGVFFNSLPGSRWLRLMEDLRLNVQLLCLFLKMLSLKKGIRLLKKFYFIHLRS